MSKQDVAETAPFCNECGGRNLATAKFCSTCGKPLKQAASPAASSAASRGVTNATPPASAKPAVGNAATSAMPAVVGPLDDTLLAAGEVVCDSRGNEYCIIVVAPEHLAPCREYQAELPKNQGGRVVRLYEAASKPPLSAVIALADIMAQGRQLPHVSPLLPPFQSDWPGQGRFYVAERVAPAELRLNASEPMWATQGEGWIRQLALGLNALHEHKLVFGFQAKDVLMHVSVMEKDQVSWKRLMDLQPLSAPAQACSDVQALASAILSMPTDPLKSNQPLKALLERARQPAARMTADQLVSELNDLAFNPPKEHITSRDATDAPLSAASKHSYAAKTDKGRMRDGNEDSLLAIGMHISNDNVTYLPLLLAVSDGMGGEDAGEIASQLTLKELHKAVTQIVTNDEEIEPKVWVQRTIKQINERVLETARKLGNQMGATLVFAFVHDGTACLGNVGDSRIYRWNAKRNGGQMVRLVKDHSLVQRLVDLGEIKDPDRYAHPERNMVLRSIGDPKNARSDDNEPVPIYAGDWLLLCSDGLWEMVRDDQIRDVLAGSRTPEEACDRLVDMANANGGEDNIAVVIARFE